MTSRQTVSLGIMLVWIMTIKISIQETFVYIYLQTMTRTLFRNVHYAWEYVPWEKHDLSETTIYIDCRARRQSAPNRTNAFYLFIARHAFRLSPPLLDSMSHTHSIHRFSLSVLPFIISSHGDLYLVHAYLQKWHDLSIGFPVFFHFFLLWWF